ncbi:hypothetical protein KFK09_013902 [Dendrobium nobile]|uniref:Uncharacterized protein n=1 Tax=Dendrobium nobile TaxID=94219 RepID=A0A8T3BA81_DENNO|nr:hypothetical protein KFK09_013902 [Dendrobium nobile]
MAQCGWHIDAKEKRKSRRVISLESVAVMGAAVTGSTLVIPGFPGQLKSILIFETGRKS